MTDTLFDPPSDTEPRPHRVRALAGVLAGFGWPDRGSFEKLTKPQQELATRAARAALTTIEREG